MGGFARCCPAGPPGESVDRLAERFAGIAVLFIVFLSWPFLDAANAAHADVLPNRLNVAFIKFTTGKTRQEVEKRITGRDKRRLGGGERILVEQLLDASTCIGSGHLAPRVRQCDFAVVRLPSRNEL